MSELAESDLNPGQPCPECGEAIVTWWADKLRSPEQSIDERHCWVRTENVEPGGLKTSFAGNVIVIDHDGPSMDT
jgi:hypothetical protein